MERKTKPQEAKMASSPVVDFPTREDIVNLKVGDLAIDAFGKMARVVGIHAQRDDIKGRAFVCYYTEHGFPGSTCSMSRKERKVTRTVALSIVYTSAEIDAIEKQLLAEVTK
jgi:hypothetical protein